MKLAVWLVAGLMLFSAAGGMAQEIASSVPESPVPAPEAKTAPDRVLEFVLDGELSGRFGAAFNSTDYRADHVPTAGLAWGLLDLEYLTPALYGFRAGTWLVGVQEIWQNHALDYDDVFIHELDLREINLRYELPESSGDLILGRREFKEPPSMGGDSHQGLGFETPDLAGVGVSAAVVNRWIHYDRTDFDARGITGWEDVGDANDRAGDIFMSLMVDWAPVEELILSPYLLYQDNVMGVLGAQAASAIALDESWGLDFTGIYAFHGNMVPEALEPDYEDVQELLLHAGAAWEMLSLGLGWYWLSDDRGDITAGVFDSFDPLQEDDYYPFDDTNHASLFYLDAGVCLEPVTLEVLWGAGKNRAYDVRTRELNIWAYWDILASVELGAYFIWTDYDGGLISDYTRFGTSLTLNF